MLFSIFCFGFLYFYWSSKEPPLYDFFSFLAIFTLGLYHYQYSSLGLALMIDSIADFNMNSHTPKVSIILFLIGHFLKQLAFLNFYSFLFIGLSFIFSYSSWYSQDSLLIFFYILSLINAWTAISLSIGYISWSYFFFVLSDAIIGYDLFICKLSNRRLRVLLVPFLYWIAEYFILYEYQHWRSHSPIY